MRFQLSVLACLLAACASSPALPLRQPQAIALDASPAMLEIARLEDQREPAGATLLAFLDDPRAAVRARAALALGRLASEPGGSRVAAELEVLAVDDPDIDVRCAALFALGQRAESSCGEALLGLTRDPQAPVRARAIEALAKLPRPDLRAAVLLALEDGDPRVRLEAAHGPQRWPRDEPSSAEVDRQLAECLEREADRDVIVYALHALERRRAAAGREAFLRFAASSDAEQRLFAVRGLRALAPDGTLLDELLQALSDPDWRIACEAALGLAAFDAPSAARALGEATRNYSPHVRRVAWEALAERVGRLETLSDARDLHTLLQPFWLQRASFEGEPSLSVRAAYQEFELPLLCKIRSLGEGWSAARTQEMLLRLAGVVEREPPLVLVGLARALGRIPEDFAAQMLAELARSSDRRVAEAALEALAQRSGEHVRQLLLGFLGHPDYGIRLAALTALGDMARAEDLPRLLELFRSTQGAVGAEVRFNAVRAAQKLSPDKPSPVAEAALADPDRYVRRVARESWTTLGLEPPAVDTSPEPLAPPPVPGADYPLYTFNPQVEIVTARGAMVFELFPAEAPVHVESFLELARRGTYDGLSFHRVVPDFVIQGGDPRGDGNGGASWRGDSLRHEIGPRKYARGSLGMPRNEDPDSGGGQFFVTHRRTPHLDGRYTIFGELVSGGGVLDAVEVGDRILAVRIL